MYFRQFLNDETACASYLFGCKTAGEFAVVDAHADLVDDYIAAAEAQGSEIAAVIETHVQADHVSGLPELVERTGATAYMPEGAGRGVRPPSPRRRRASRARQHRDRGGRDARSRRRPPRLPGHRSPPRVRSRGWC